MGFKRRFMGAERQDPVIRSRGEGDHGMGGHQEPAGGNVTEGSRPLADEEGMRSKPQLKQFRFGRRQKWPQPRRKL